jgi:hypothetical protein
MVNGYFQEIDLHCVGKIQRASIHITLPLSSFRLFHGNGLQDFPARQPDHTDIVDIVPATIPAR